MQTAKPGTLAWLTPAQAQAYHEALERLSPGSAVALYATHGMNWMGTTTVLKALQRFTGGAYLDVMDIVELTRLRHPRNFEQSVYQVVREALRDNDYIYLDRLPSGGGDRYPRNGLGDTVLRMVNEAVQRDQKRAVVVGDDISGALGVEIAEFQVDDYARVVGNILGAGNCAAVDFAKVHETRRGLTARHLAQMARSLKAIYPDKVTTGQVSRAAAALRRTNLNIENVERINFEDLIGFEPLLRRLDQAILLPLREPELAKRMGLEAKHGVLLHGPPGSGKTSIGRALAHRMEGSFFMIDGDYNQQAKGCFYKNTSAVFDMAAMNAPSVIFVDDADVILGDPGMQQWGRFLLTKLDGLQSRSAGRVCVMMTAMNLADMPPALLRSGRLEVWLETKLPDRQAREKMLRLHLSRLPFQGGDEALEEVADLTEGFTPADIRALVHDSTGYLAFDRARGRRVEDVRTYLIKAAHEMKAHKVLTATAAA